jgi:hypothetical protein
LRVAEAQEDRDTIDELHSFQPRGAKMTAALMALVDAALLKRL